MSITARELRAHFSRLPTLADRPRMAVPKHQPRVLDRIEQKQALAKQERECRKAVKARDKGRCVVPACKKASVNLHHITFRSQGGKWVTSNVASLCVFHHQLVHARLLTIAGDADRQLTFTGKATT